jgi:hypothetical protein
VIDRLQCRLGLAAGKQGATHQHELRGDAELITSGAMLTFGAKVEARADSGLFLASRF